MSHPALKILSKRLDDLRGQGLERSLLPTGPANGTRIVVHGQPLLLMAGNDYLGLSRHPRLAQAASRAAASLGSGTGASRLVSGTLDSHAQLERACAEFKHSQAAVFLSSGYLTNLAVITALAGPGDLIVSDALNHASIIDGCRMSRAQVKVYPHCDFRAAEKLLAQGQSDGIKLLVSDGVFSMDGDLAPLPELLEAARRHNALLMLDDAHATGVYGATGRGSLEHFGLEACPELVTVGTFSKSLGGFGGFAAGTKEVIDTLINRARPFIYTTAPPPAQVAACLESFKVLDDELWRVERLHSLSGKLRQGLRDQGFEVISEHGPIIPVLIGDAGRAFEMGQVLRKHGVFAPAMRPPTVPMGSSRIRFAVSAAHQEDDITFVLQAMAKAAEEVGL